MVNDVTVLDKQAEENMDRVGRMRAEYLKGNVTYWEALVCVLIHILKSI